MRAQGTAATALIARRINSRPLPGVHTGGARVFCRPFPRHLWLIPPPDHIKLDVDGIEAEIIQVARRTLASVISVLVEVEGRSGAAGAASIEATLNAAGLLEDPAIRTQGSCRNRLFRRQ